MIRSLLIIFLTTGAQIGFAYVPPSEFIIKKIAAQKSDLKTVGIETSIQAIEQDKPIGLPFKETVRINFQSRGMDQLILDSEGRTVYRNFLKLDHLESVGAHLLLQSDADIVIRYLNEKKVPILRERELLKYSDENKRRAIEITRFDRFQGLLLWVLGQLKQDTPELWIEKDSFKPIRYLNLEQTELRLIDYLSYQGLTYPKEQMIFISGKLKVRGTSVLALPEKTNVLFKDGQALNQGFGYTQEGRELQTDAKSLLSNYLFYLR